MNNKHIACSIVVVVIILLVQATLWARNAYTKMNAQAVAAARAEATASTKLVQEQKQLADLQTRSAPLISFLETWQPYFRALDNPQSAEVNFTMRVKESNLINLAQRFDQNAVKGIASIPGALRAHLTFEDDYARLMNWLGRLESEVPTARVSNLRVSRGTRPNELRMEVTLEQPLLKK